MFIDGTTVQLVVLVFVVLDVLCVICELLMVATKCGDDCMSCAEDTYPCIVDVLSGGDHAEDDYHRAFMRALGAVDPHAAPSCAFHAHHGLSDTQYAYEHVFHMISVSILILFEVQIVLQILVYGQLFFTKPFYVADFIVVSKFFRICA